MLNPDLLLSWGGGAVSTPVPRGGEVGAGGGGVGESGLLSLEGRGLR